MQPSELLEYDSCLVPFKQELPFQEGKPLSRITEEAESRTKLVEYSHMAKTSPDQQVYMASLHISKEDEPGPEYDAELLAAISIDERMMDAPQDENKERRRIWQLKNAKCAKRRWKTENRARNPLYHRNLSNAFGAAKEREPHPDQCHCRGSAPSITIAAKPQVQRLQYPTQLALVQLDEQNPFSSTRNTLLRSEHHDDSTQVSRTPKGGLRP
jgi:hypothetical protein